MPTQRSRIMRGLKRLNPLTWYKGHQRSSVPAIATRVQEVQTDPEGRHEHDVDDYDNPPVIEWAGRLVKVSEPMRWIDPQLTLPPPVRVEPSTPLDALGVHVPYYGYVTTRNCTDIMCALEDDQLGAPKDDLTCRLLRAAQWVYMSASLLQWVDTKPDLSNLCVRGELFLTPADVRGRCKVIHRKSVGRGRHWQAFLRDMMEPHKLGSWKVNWEVDEKGDCLTIRHCCFGCARKWDGEPGEYEPRKTMVVLACAGCKALKLGGIPGNYQYPLCPECACMHLRKRQCPRADGLVHKFDTTRITPKAFLVDMADVKGAGNQY